MLNGLVCTKIYQELLKLINEILLAKVCFTFYLDVFIIRLTCI